MKVIKRIILAGIVLIVLLGLAAYFAVKMAFPPAKIKELVHKHGYEALHRDVTVEDVTIHIFPNLKVSVLEVNVANAPGFSNNPCVKLRELALSIDFLSLLKLSPVINEIKLVEPEILYEISRNGHNNLEGMSSPDTGKTQEKAVSKPMESPAAVALKAFTIENGRVRYKDLQSGRELVLDKINQSVSLDLDQKLENVATKGKLEISGISVMDSASALRQGNIRVTVRHDIRLNLPAEKLEVRTLELSFQDIRATVKGEASHFLTKPPTIDFSLSAPDIKLASVLKEIPANLSPDLAKLSVKGVAALEARVQGVLDTAKAPNVSAHFTIRDAGVSHKDLPAGIDAMNLDLDLAGDSLKLDQFAFTLGGNPVSMNALVTSLRDAAPMLRDFNLKAVLDLGKLIPLAEKMSLVDPGLKADGIIQANIKASGKLDPKAPQNLRAQGVVEMRNVAAQGKPLPQPVKLNGQIKIDNEKIGETLALGIGSSDLNVSGTVVNYLAMVLPKAAAGQTTKAKLSIQSSFLNLDELLPGGGEKETAKDTTPMAAWPKLPKVDADVDLKLAKTRLMNLDMTDFSSHSSLAAGVLNTSLKGSLYSGGFTSSLHADMQDASNAKIALKLDVAKVEANDFISRLNKRLPATNRLMQTLAHTDSTIFGKFNLNVDVATHGLPPALADNLTGKIAFALIDGKLRETGLLHGLSDALGKVSKSLAFHDLTFSSLKADLEAAGGKLLVKDFNISESPIGAVAADGSVGFDNSLALNLESHLPAGASQAVVGAGNALSSEVSKMAGVPTGNLNMVPTDKAGRAMVYFLIGGILAKPTFALDSKRMASESGKGAKSALTDVVNKKKAELQAKADAEKTKLAAEAKARADEEKKKVQAKVDEQKKAATGAAKDQGKKVLKNLGF